jgi:hypothetical protein
MWIEGRAGQGLVVHFYTVSVVDFGNFDQKTPRFLCPVWKNPGRTHGCK